MAVFLRAADLLAGRFRDPAGNVYINEKPTGAVGRTTALRRRPGFGDQRQGGQRLGT